MTPDRLELAVQVIRRLNPHPGRFACYVHQRNQYVQVRRAPTDQEVVEHIRGRRLLGAVSADDQGMTTAVGLDLDAHVSGQRPLAAAKRFVQACQVFDIPVLVHTSKSAKGCHVRTLFNKETPSWMARAMYVALAVSSDLNQDSACDKVWPPSHGYGVLALPYQGRYAVQNGGTIALNPNTWLPYPQDVQLDVVTEAREMDTDDIEGVLRTFGINTERQAKLLAGAALSGPTEPSCRDGTDGGVQEMINHCAAVKRLEEEAGTVPYVFWFGMMTNFRPFANGRELFEAYCELDPKRHDPRALDRMWKAITGRPRICLHLDPQWTCPLQGRCPANAPAGLPFAVKRAQKKREQGDKSEG
ncbi:MAG: hypothetical protein WC683_02285 [bacterium]